MFFRYFFLTFIALAILEVFVLIEVGSWLGAPMTVALIILTGVIGVSLLKAQGLEVFQRFQGKMQQGEPPALELIEGVLLIIAGAFLVTPGFVTDSLGFLWLIPATRTLFAQGLVKAGWFKFQQGRGNGFFYYQSSHYSQTANRETERHQSAAKDPERTVIEGEYERLDDKKDK